MSDETQAPPAEPPRLALGDVREVISDAEELRKGSALYDLGVLADLSRHGRRVYGLVPGATTYRVQLAFGEVKPGKLSKAEEGHLKKAGAAPMRHLVEFRDVGLDLGTFISDYVTPIVAEVKKITDNLQRIRELCTQHGALFVFDEVMTGFRVALGGAQSVYAKLIPGFQPDMSVFGKVIGGGMPLAAFGAKRAVMEQLAPLGPVYQAGTLSGNPVATACGLATLREIRKPGFHEALAAKTKTLVDGLLGAAREAGVPMVGDSEGGMFGFFFSDALPQNYPAVMATDKERFNAFFHAMLEEGVYFAPALYEASFMSAAHADADIAATIEAARKALKR
mgnify:CR=1 FL=1